MEGREGGRFHLNGGDQGKTDRSVGRGPFEQRPEGEEGAIQQSEAAHACSPSYMGS
jgi:hypothetical protein